MAGGARFAGPGRPAPRRSGEAAGPGRQANQGDIAMGVLQGKVAVITGAGNGIGRSHALAFAREGARVVVNEDQGLTGSESSPLHQHYRLC